MNVLRDTRMWFSVLVIVLVTVGCEPNGAHDEQKEPHYLTGKSRANAYDFVGAVQSYERALQANPQSASAHLELGLLQSDKDTVLDHAAAIYHLQHFLRLQTNAHNADMIRERITVCKQGLAREVPLGPVTQQVQREIMRLTSENSRLTNEVVVLRQQLDQLRLYLAQRAAQTPAPPTQETLATLPPGMVASNRQPSITVPAPAVPSPITSAPPAVARGPGPSGGGQGGSGSLTGPAARIVAPKAGVHPPTVVTPPVNPVQPASVLRTYKVRSGDTPGAIAKRYNVKLKDLLAANPGLNPNRMQINQVLKIPAP